MTSTPVSWWGANRLLTSSRYQRALAALKNALAAFDDAKDVTRLMRSESDSLADSQSQVAEQELAYVNKLIELYGTPLPGRCRTGPDLRSRLYRTGLSALHICTTCMWIWRNLAYNKAFDPAKTVVYKVDSQLFPDLRRA